MYIMVTATYTTMLDTALNTCQMREKSNYTLVMFGAECENRLKSLCFLLLQNTSLMYTITKYGST